MADRPRDKHTWAKVLAVIIIGVIIFLIGMRCGIGIVTSTQYFSVKAQHDVAMMIFWAIVALLVLLLILVFFLRHKWNQHKKNKQLSREQQQNNQDE